MAISRRPYIALVAAAMLAALASQGFTGTMPYEVGRTVIDGRTLVQIVVPGRPPEVKAAVAQVPEPDIANGINVLPNVPAFTWCYGCSATSAAMIMGYYDNDTYPDMYTGPANGGVCPMNNESFWGHTNYPSAGSVGECPLSATHMGYDGRATRGHVDDYWIDYGQGGPDPYYGNWTEHTKGDCTADYMGTNQAGVNCSDGSTYFFYWENGDALNDYTGHEPGYRDGCHGMKLFVESRGYSVTSNFTQWVYPNPVNPGNNHGYTFDNFKADIDAGRPVMIQVQGHSMVGYGYNDSGSIVYIHDTWDNSGHTMTWGSSYSGMSHYGVTVIRLADSGIDPLTLTYPSDTGIAFQRGTPCLIQWESHTGSLNSRSLMQIVLYSSSGGPWVLAASTPNTGSWLWKSVGAWKSKTQAGYPDNDDYTIVISSLTGGYSDESDNDFAIGSVTSLEIGGATSVTGGDCTQQYTCTGHMNYGADQDVTNLVKWGSDKTLKVAGAKMGKTGVLATAPVGAPSPFHITATYGKGKPPLNTSYPITIAP